MNLLKTLRADSKVVSVVGSGGKSTYLLALARELATTPAPSAEKNVLLLTTTHMVAPKELPYLEDPTEDELAQTLEELSCSTKALNPVLCIGKTTGELTCEGQPKICAPTLPMATLTKHARYLLIEADGSKRLPLKLHAAHEPVVPPRSDTCICIVGASGFMQPAGTVLHRWDSRGQAFGISQDTVMTPELTAKLMAQEISRGVFKPDVLIVNQAEDEERLQEATQFCRTLLELHPNIVCFAGSLQSSQLGSIEHQS